MENDRVRELLDAERERIETALYSVRGPAGDGEELAPLDQHPADLGTETFEDERDEGLHERLRQEAEALERAEQRLKDGTYGRSVESGEPIPDKRLEAQPLAERTVEEQSRLERA